MTIDSFLCKDKNTSGFKIGQIVDARSRHWKIERIISKKSEFDEKSEINLLEVSSITVVPNRCNLLLGIVKAVDGKKEIKKLEEIKVAEIPKPDIGILFIFFNPTIYEYNLVKIFSLTFQVSLN